MKKNTFDSQDFCNFLETLISRHRRSYYKVGKVYPFHGNEEVFLIIIYHKLFIINKKMETTIIPLHKTSFEQLVGERYIYSTTGINMIENNRFNLNNNIKNEIEKYMKTLPKYEKEILSEVDHTQNNLLSNQQLKTLLTNFLDQYCQDFFRKPRFPFIYEDDLLKEIVNRKKKSTFYITQDARNQLEYDYQRLLVVLKNRNFVDEDFPIQYGYLMLTRTLRTLGLEYFPLQFEERYGGYFSDNRTLSLNEFIDSYFQIDFVDKSEEVNIGFFTYYLYSKRIKEISRLKFLNAFYLVKEKIEEYEKNKELHLFEQQLIKGTESYYKNGYDGVSLDEVDLMSGTEFEEFIYDLFKRMGYSVNLTPGTGDQGIDLIAVKSGLRIGVQIKCYSNSVSNKAVQEVVAGIKHHGLTKAVVITNNFFTKSAMDLAISNDVTLWDRNLLKEKIKELY